MKPCIVCGKPRDGDRIWCGDDACLQVVLAMPVEEISSIRQHEALAAWQQMSADGRGIYIHVTPKGPKP